MLITHHQGDDQCLKKYPLKVILSNGVIKLIAVSVVTTPLALLDVKCSALL